jgi:hypothetical protein
MAADELERRKQSAGHCISWNLSRICTRETNKWMEGRRKTGEHEDKMGKQGQHFF